MNGIKTPIEIESNLSWNRLVRQSFQALPVPESWGVQWRFQIPPVSYSANGFVYLIGVGSDSAPPTWRLGCSVRLASGAVPDSTGEFNSAGGLPLRIDDRRPCTLGSYTLLTWPDMNLANEHLIIEFPHWLQDATIEIFWYDGETSGDFFSKLRESLAEIFGDRHFLETNFNGYLTDKILPLFSAHESNPDAHPELLRLWRAEELFVSKIELDVAIADSDALRIALDNYLLKSEANAAFVALETFNQERTFVDAAIDEAKAIAAADLAAHLGATNPHNISPKAIGALEEGFRTHDHDEKYAAIDHSHEAIAPTANLQANSLTLNQPLGLLGGGTGATTVVDALANLGAAAASHTHTSTQITGIAAIANGGTGASTAAAALANLGAAAFNHTHPNLNQINTLLAANQSSQIGVLGNCVFLFTNFCAYQGLWININSFTQSSRIRVNLIGCVVNNWEGGNGIMHGWRECDLSSTNVGSITYQSVSLLFRLNSGNLQASAQGAYSAGGIQFQGILLCYGY